MNTDPEDTDLWIATKQPVKAGLNDPNWKYIPAAATDILARFRSMGWVPPSEVKKGGTE